MRSPALVTRLMLASLLWAAAPSAIAGSDAGGQAPLNAQDRQFLYWATESGKAHAALNQLAVEKTRNDAIKAFAQQALAENKQREEKLAALSRAHQISPPQQPDKDDRDLHDNLAAMSGDAFDHLFMRNAVAEALKTINLYEQEATGGQSAEIKGFVAAVLPQLQQHYEEARKVDEKLPGTAPLMSPSGTIETHRPMSNPMSR